MTNSNLVGSRLADRPVCALEMLSTKKAERRKLSVPMKQRKAFSSVHTIGSLRTLKLVLTSTGHPVKPVKAAEQPAWEPRGGCRAHRQHSTVDRCRGPTSTFQKRLTKKGPRRQQAGSVPPLPNSAHGEQLISAEPRGTARLGWMAPLRHLGARVLVGSSSSTRVSSLRASPITCSISIPTTFANTPRNSVGWPSSVR